MKKIFSFILIAISLNGLAQTGFPVTQSMASANTKLQVNGGLQAVRGLINGVFTDTTAANLDKIDFYNGAQIYTRSDRNFWLRDSVLNMWIRMAKFSEVGGTDTHFGNTNLTFTADRVHNLSSNSLNIGNSGEKHFWIEPGSRYQFGSFEEATIGTGLDMDQVAQTTKLGALADNTKLFIDSDNGKIDFSVAGSRFFEISDNDYVDVGDLDGNLNGTKIRVDIDNDKIFFKESSLAGASVNYVWTLQNTTTGEGAWEAAGGGSGARFGFSGEDDAAGEDRIMDMNSQLLMIEDASDIDLHVGAISRIRAGALSSHLYSPNSNGYTTNDAVVGIKLNDATNDSLMIDDVNIVTKNDNDYVFLQRGSVGSDRVSKITVANLLAANNALVDPFDVITNFGYSDEVHIRQSSFGAGSTIGTLSVTTIFDGWMFGQYMETGTTTTGSSYNYSYSSGSVGGIAISNSFRYNAGGLVRIPVLSDGTDTYNYMLGFADDAGNGVSSIVDGIYFEYSHALNSGNWTFTTESNGTKTQTDTGIPVVVNTDYKLNVSVYNGNAFGYIDNVLVATNTTNIPTGTARATGFANSLAKTAGTTNVKAFVEYLGWGKRPN